MRNFVQEGVVLTVIAPAAVTSGQLVIVGNIAGVSAYDAASGAEAELRVEGVFTLPKVAGDAITAGQPVKATAAGVVSAAGSFTIGYAVAAAGAGTTTVTVRLVPSV